MATNWQRGFVEIPMSPVTARLNYSTALGMSLLLDFWRGMKGLLRSMFEWFGELGLFCGRVARAGLTSRFEGSELIRQMDAIGAKSLPLVALAGAATGVVLSLQTGDSLARFGAKSLLPAVIIFSLIKESGPVITGLVVSGRVGAGIGAELA